MSQQPRQELRQSCWRPEHQPLWFLQAVVLLSPTVELVEAVKTAEAAVMVAVMAVARRWRRLWVEGGE